MIIIGWHLYYVDGSVVSSRDTSWDQAPSDNVLGLLIFYEETYSIWRDGVERTEHYRKELLGGDYYWPYGTGSADQVPEAASVKLGREVSNDAYTEMYNRMHNDLEL